MHKLHRRVKYAMCVYRLFCLQQIKRAEFVCFSFFTNLSLFVLPLAAKRKGWISPRFKAECRPPPLSIPSLMHSIWLAFISFISICIICFSNSNAFTGVCIGRRLEVGLDWTDADLDCHKKQPARLYSIQSNSHYFVHFFNLLHMFSFSISWQHLHCWYRLSLLLAR